MSTAASTRGDSLKAEGNKALNRTLIFGFGKQQKFEDAAEAFKNAGNAYKLASLWQSAGDVFMQAGDAYMKVDSTTDATACVVEAAQCYKKVDPNAAVIAYQQAIDMYNTNGRFGMSSRYAKEMAEVYEQDNNAEGALKAYESAAELYNSDNKKSNANQCLLKVATLSAEKGDLSRAAGIYEDIARESMTSRLGAYSAKGYFFQSLLCYLAMGDNVQVERKLAECKNIDYSFEGSRECDFIQKILQSCNDLNLEDFSEACADFDRITPLDPWKTSMLLRAKKFISDAAGDDNGDVDLS